MTSILILISDQSGYKYLTNCFEISLFRILENRTGARAEIRSCLLSPRKHGATDIFNSDVQVLNMPSVGLTSGELNVPEKNISKLHTH